MEFDPFADAPDVVDVEPWLKQQGWEEFLGIGGEQADLRLQSWHRSVDGRSEYALQVWDANQGSPYIRLDSFVELMDVMARWAPAFEAAAVVGLLERAQAFGLDVDGQVEMIAAKVAFGTTTGLAAVEKEMRAQSERRRKDRQE